MHPLVMSKLWCFFFGGLMGFNGSFIGLIGGFMGFIIDVNSGDV